MSQATVVSLVPRLRWTEQAVLAEARKRTRRFAVENSSKIQSMLASLLVEAGWTEEEFINALCKDVITRSRDKKVATRSRK